MGDRAMCEIITSEGSIFFYTHWHGESLPTIAKEALTLAQPRIADESYACRIVIDQLIKNGGGRDCDTGSGVMLTPSAEDEYNNDSPSVTIDLTNNCVITAGRTFTIWRYTDD